MNSITLTINNHDVTVPEGCTIMEAAQELKISIPHLCYLNGEERFTSCMICVVQEMNSGQLLPSCSAAVIEGMRIETETDKVRDARKAALDFLLSEHVGDCEAPCQRACPAHMNIPLMIRQIESRQFAQAIQTVKQRIALPAVLGCICSAPCEKGCNRKFYDSPVSICLLKRYVADVDLAQASPYRPAVKSKSGKKVAVIGAGPTGLAAAYYLLQEGHDCFIYDQNPLPGGMLRYKVPDDRLPKSVLDAEIKRISEFGARFLMGHSLGTDIGWEELKDNYDAVVLAVGKIASGIFDDSGIELTARGLVIDRKTFATTVTGIFAGGNAVGESRMAIRAVAHGKGIAYSVNQFLHNEAITGFIPRFNSMMGKLREGEVAEFLQEAGEHSRIDPVGGFATGYAEAEAVKESLRCFGCDCSKLDSCKLRMYSEEYDAEQYRFKFNQRGKFQKILQHDLVVYEPGKCIKCGLCVQITKKIGEEFGLTFINRGFDVRIEVPFNEPLQQGLKKAAKECIEACPTAALSWRERA